jgi:hypothetical protein
VQAFPEQVRFRRDVSLMQELRQDPAVQRQLSVLEARRRSGGSRVHMLANAVRADTTLIPRLGPRLERVREVTKERHVEPYVYNEPSVNALVLAGENEIILGLSSGALNLLDDRELDFVIGHELGHARFEHLDIAVGHLVAENGLAPISSVKLRAWQRAAEISADRFGLHYCGLLSVAASALFKSISGLRVDFEVDPTQFAAQWDHLKQEISVTGTRDHWELSHPFPPLRMKAMLFYWSYLTGEAPLDGVDREVERLLASMDPSAADDTLGDVLLASFFFWGGLYIALADGVLAQVELERLASVAPPAVDVAQVVASDPMGHGCLERFRTEIAQRRRKLSSVELYRIVEGLVDVATADGRFEPVEVARLYQLGQVLGLPQHACDLLIAKITGGH